MLILQPPVTRGSIPSTSDSFLYNETFPGTGRIDFKSYVEQTSTTGVSISFEVDRFLGSSGASSVRVVSSGPVGSHTPFDQTFNWADGEMGSHAFTIEIPAHTLDGEEWVKLELQDITNSVYDRPSWPAAYINIDDGSISSTLTADDAVFLDLNAVSDGTGTRLSPRNNLQAAWNQFADLYDADPTKPRTFFGSGNGFMVDGDLPLEPPRILAPENFAVIRDWPGMPKFTISGSGTPDHTAQGYANNFRNGIFYASSGGPANRGNMSYCRFKNIEMIDMYPYNPNDNVTSPGTQVTDQCAFIWVIGVPSVELMGLNLDLHGVDTTSNASCVRIEDTQATMWSNINMYDSTQFRGLGFRDPWDRSPGNGVLSFRCEEIAIEKATMFDGALLLRKDTDNSDTKAFSIRNSVAIGGHVAYMLANNPNYHSFTVVCNNVEYNNGYYGWLHLTQLAAGTGTSHDHWITNNTIHRIAYTGSPSVTENPDIEYGPAAELYARMGNITYFSDYIFTRTGLVDNGSATQPPMQLARYNNDYIYTNYYRLDTVAGGVFANPGALQVTYPDLETNNLSGDPLFTGPLPTHVPNINTFDPTVYRLQGGSPNVSSSFDGRNRGAYQNGNETIGYTP